MTSTPDARKHARTLMAEKQLGVTFRFSIGGTERDVEYEGIGEFAIPEGAESFVLWTHRLGNATGNGRRPGPVEGAIATLIERGVDELVVLALQRSDVRLA